MLLLCILASVVQNYSKIRSELFAWFRQTDTIFIFLIVYYLLLQTHWTNKEIYYDFSLVTLWFNQNRSINLMLYRLYLATYSWNNEFYYCFIIHLKWSRTPKSLQGEDSTASKGRGERELKSYKNTSCLRFVFSPNQHDLLTTCCQTGFGAVRSKNPQVERVTFPKGPDFPSPEGTHQNRRVVSYLSSLW